jgi:hypothetical protein
MAGSHYTGKAGQFAVMSELARRGYNVSIPEIDIGYDVFVLNDASGQLSRVQVKTATGKKLKRGDRPPYRCQFSLKRSHVINSQSGTHYVLAARCGGAWRFLVFKRYILARLIKKGLGTRIRGSRGRHMLTVIFFDRRTAKSSTKKNAVNLSKHANRWTLWKLLKGGLASN